MKQFFLVLGLAAVSAAAQTVTPFYELARDGEVVKEYTSLAYCEAGAKGLGTKAGGTTVFDCVRRVRVVAPVVDAPVPSPVPTPAPAPAPAPTSAWVEGKSAVTEPTTARPARGALTRDPFGQALYRVSDSADPVTGFARNDYSRRQAFSAGNKWQLVYSNDGHWHVYDAEMLKYGKKLAGPAGDAEPQWHPTNADLLHFLGNNGVGLKLHELNVATNQNRVVADFGPRLKAKWPTATFAWTKSEGSPSADGRYWCFMVDNASFSGVGVFTWDMQTDTILGMHSTTDRPDHVSMSPSGNYCVVSGDSARGTVAFSRDFVTSRKLLAKSEHSDMALLPNGDDAFVAVDYQSGAGDVFFINLRTGERTVLFPSYLSGTARAFHFSGKGYGVPGWVLISTYGEYGGAKQWLDRKVFLVELKASPRVLNVAFHRSNVASYFFEPHATISRDGSRVAFTSSWGGTTLADLHAYQVRIPAIK